MEQSRARFELVRTDDGSRRFPCGVHERALRRWVELGTCSIVELEG